MPIISATITDLDEAVASLVAAFAHDHITTFLLEAGDNYAPRLTTFFSLLLRARLALGMPVLVARDGERVIGAAMGYSTAPHDWPADIADEWDHLERSIPGLAGRMAAYDEIAADARPTVPHYYLGAIGIDPSLHGRGIGKQLLKAFCDLSANDALSSGVYLETAKESNVGFYERAGFVETGSGTMGGTRLWCMYLRHEGR